MKKKHILTLLCFALLTVMSGFQVTEDPEFLQKLKVRLTYFNKIRPSEKIYLQFDKPFYKPGEDIWFNAFVLNGTTHKPTHTSDVLYVELIDPKGNTASKLELLIREGTSHGDFHLDQTAPGGVYKIRAYTQWNRNEAEQDFFTRTIQVQKIITPRLLFKFDFEKKAYGPGEKVSATLEVRNLKNERVSSAPVKILVNLSGTRYSSSSFITNNTGEATIHFNLPDTLSSSDGLLQMIVNANGTEESISRSIPIVLNRIALEFFPEGGNSIAGIESRIAFKALNEFGKGADVKGIVIDDLNTTVATFESFHRGMGAFTLKPEPGRKYFARITSPSTKSERIPLPESRPSGMVLNFEALQSENASFSIHSSKHSDAFLVGQSHGTIWYSRRLSLRKGSNTLSVPTTNFPAGIAAFTLFNESGTPQAERLVYLNPERRLNIEVNTSKERYQPGEDVEITITTTDPNGKPLPAKLSLSVVDDQLISFADDRQDNLLSRMLLTTEVKGEVEEPSFYFDPTESKASQALDYLLMTQGWRRFSWDKLKEAETPVIFLPEKVKAIAGRVVSKDGKGRAAEVTLLELGKQKRIIRVQTTPEGLFVFKNTDPTIPALLLTEKNGEIRLQKEKQIMHIQTASRDTTISNPAVEKLRIVDVEEKEEAPKRVAKAEASPGGLDMALDGDVSQLSEVVVTGYGTQVRENITSSVTVVHGNDMNVLASFPSVESALQGRVSGVMVTQPNYGASALTGISIRGISSLGSGKGEPLFVIDGHQIGTSINSNFSNGSFVDPADIQTIEVIKSPEATAIFGSQAVNGAILITTKNGIGHRYIPHKNKPAKYSSVLVTPRKFSPVREFYSPPMSRAATKREDFRTTVYWNPLVTTNEKGTAKLTFRNNDAVSSFRITAEGITGAGMIGRNEKVYSTLLPFSLDTKLPEFLGFEDVLKLPVIVKNEMTNPLSGELTVSVGKGLLTQDENNIKINIQPGMSETYLFTIAPTGIEGVNPVAIKLDAGGRTDEIRQNIAVKPTGFPMQVSFSAKQMEKNVRFQINDAEQGSLRASFTAYPDVLADLVSGVESIFREPYGCFEQTSSSTFPNILALQYLQNSGTANSAVQRKALEYIRSGYKRLISYEVSGGGFEWFGKPPAHEALTAYGLIEFVEMKKVYPDVDQKMIDRTRNWLLSRRTGEGTFRLQSRGLDDFSRPSGDISNAYITYALSETGTVGLKKEFQYNLGKAWESKDMYQLALMANTAFNLNETEAYERLILYFNKHVAGSTIDNMTASHSVVWSQGKSLTTETASLWALALLKTGLTNLEQAKMCVDFICSRRSFGSFGSTQATVLALKALAEYARIARATMHSGQVRLTVNGKVVEHIPYESSRREDITSAHFQSALTNDGEQLLGISFVDTPEPLPYSVNIQWHTKRPHSSDECKIDLTTALATEHVKLNETVRMGIMLKNKSLGGVPMTIAVIGIPAGLSAQPWQLKELQEKEVFDFYEIHDGKLVLYYRQMGPQEMRQINLDLKAEQKGTFTAPASSGYLYYTNEHKKWVRGPSVVID